MCLSDKKVTGDLVRRVEKGGRNNEVAVMMGQAEGKIAVCNNSGQNYGALLQTALPRPSYGFSPNKKRSFGRTSPFLLPTQCCYHGDGLWHSDPPLLQLYMGRGKGRIFHKLCTKAKESHISRPGLEQKNKSKSNDLKRTISLPHPFPFRPERGLQTKV